MQTLIELAPLLAFFVAYKWFGGIYPATAVLMGAMALLLAWDWLRTRTVPKMHLISAILVWVFGIATLLLRDQRFIQWKATVFYWLVALVFLGTTFIGKKTLLERMLATVLPEGTNTSRATWRNLSLLSAVFYLGLGAFNLWAAYTLPEDTWVSLKTWFFVPAIFIFTAIVTFWLLRGYQPPKEPT
jgi:intracellular septation protein